MANSASRLFFALWPDSATALRIQRQVRGLIPISVGRSVAVDQLHITLAYLGRQSLIQQQCAMSVANEIPLRPFSLVLNLVGHFSRARVVWLGASLIPPELADLQAKLVNQLKIQCDYQPENRPFVPHVTLRRKVSRFTASESSDSIDWYVSRFVLARSESLATGVRYSVIRTWSAQA